MRFLRGASVSLACDDPCIMAGYQPRAFTCQQGDFLVQVTKPMHIDKQCDPWRNLFYKRWVILKEPSFLWCCVLA